jgi:CheY-like chemotaxis protein
VARRKVRKPRLLIVDDHPATRDTLARLFEGVGYTVALAADGREGLAELARGSPDVILLDLFMPVMSGWEFLRAMQTLGANASVPVIVMSSAFGMDADLPFAGVAAVVPKPCKQDDLLAKVGACLGPAASP